MLARITFHSLLLLCLFLPDFASVPCLAQGGSRRCEYGSYVLHTDFGNPASNVGDLVTDVGTEGVRYVLRCIEMGTTCKWVWIPILVLAVDLAQEGAYTCFTDLCLINPGQPEHVVVTEVIWLDHYENGIPFIPSKTYTVPAKNPEWAERCREYRDFFDAHFRSGYRCYPPFNCINGWN